MQRCLPQVVKPNGEQTDSRDLVLARATGTSTGIKQQEKGETQIGTN
jgi:hypothetical protein